MAPDQISVISDVTFDLAYLSTDHVASTLRYVYIMVT